MISMRPKSTTADLPSSYDVKVHLHNEFVKYMKDLKESIIVSGFYERLFELIETYLDRRHLEKSQSLEMDGRQIQQSRVFKG